VELEIRQHLRETAVIGREIRCFDVIDSTNTYTKQLAQEGVADGTVVIANAQTGGRGRVGRTFQSAEGKGLYFTALLKPELPTERLLPITALAGVSSCRAIERVCGARTGLKWPNDLVLNGKKLAGILTELVMVGERPCVVLGIGINISQGKTDFTPEVAEIATSLEMEESRPVDRAALAAALIEELDSMYAALKDEGLTAYLSAYRRDCVNLGRIVQLISSDGSREIARALDVDENFALVVETQAGERQTVRSGEVSVRGFYGYIE